ncbi:MAG TPA: hypothetical protein VFR18_09260 [Terriglobia bacterium]|nr:hypothetical protein [Terriglobia bacterium]
MDSAAFATIAIKTRVVNPIHIYMAPNGLDISHGRQAPSAATADYAATLAVVPGFNSMPWRNT